MDLSEKIMAGAALSFTGFVLTDVYAGPLAAKITVGVVLMLAVVGGAWISVQKIRLHLRKQAAEVASLETDSRVRFIKGRSGILQYEADTGTSTFFHRSARLPKPVMQAAAEAVADSPMKPVIPVIRNSLSLVLLGPQGTGKTTLLCHLIDARADGEPIIIDPHGYPGKYGDREIIGAGRDYGAIDQAFEMLIQEMNRRYQDYYRTDYHRLWIYIDETTLLNKNCHHFQKFMEVALTEFRKANMRLTLCLHSRRAKFLGLAGGYDLAEGIDWLTLKKDRGRRWAVLENETGDTDMALPGPYHGSRSRHDVATPPPREPGQCHGHDTRDNHDIRDGRDMLEYIPGHDTCAVYDDLKPKRFFESQQEKQIVDMAEAGHSLNSIARAIWGSSNGRRTKTLKALLSQHGLRHHT